MTFEMKPLACDLKRLRGLSEKLILSHYENNYGGAVKRLGAITAQLRAVFLLRAVRRARRGHGLGSAGRRASPVRSKSVALTRARTDRRGKLMLSGRPPLTDRAGKSNLHDSVVMTQGKKSSDRAEPPKSASGTQLAESAAPSSVRREHARFAVDLEVKPKEAAPWVYREWFQLLVWHEAHHHGQAHLTYNLYRGK